MIEYYMIAILYLSGMGAFFLLLTEMKAKTSSIVAKIGLVFILMIWPLLVLASYIVALFKK